MHGFLGSQIFGGPISEQREWLRTMTLKSALVDGHLHAQCLVCLQPAHHVIPGQTLAIGYGRSRVALGRSNHLKTSTDTHLQVSERLSIEQTFQTFCTNEMKYDGLVGPGYLIYATGVYFKKS